MLEGVVKRVGGMPRSGWKLATEYFCEKLKSSCPDLDLKRNSSLAMIDCHGKMCSQLKFKAESVKRQKQDMSTMLKISMKDQEQELDIKAKQAFLECLKNIDSTPVEKNPRTLKIANELVDMQKLGYVNDALK